MGFKDPIVSIAKCPNYDDFEAVKKAVSSTLDLIGGIESVITPGDHVLLKPNLLGSFDYKSGATTNPNVIFAVAELCREVGAKQITIAEGAAIGNDTDKVYDDLGLREQATRYNCRLVNLLKDEFQYVMNPMGKNMKRLRLPKTFMECNVVINLPVMKTHDILAVTLGLKNMKGVIHNSDKKRFHKWGLAQTVVDLGKLAMPELTIMDGTIALEGMGPVVGKPVGLGLLLASTDTVALDRICMEIMGFSLDEVEYIKMAGEQGLGCTDLSRIKLMGEALEDVKRPFERLSYDSKILDEAGIKVVECDACTGCNNMVSSYLYGLHAKGELDKLKDCTLVYGQNPHIPEDASDKVVLLGVCTRNIRKGNEVYVPGCPPHPLHVNDFLEGTGLEKE